MKPFLLSLMALLLFAVQAPAEEEGGETGITCDPNTPCWICDPSLREKGRLWCKEHDRYEDRCWLCHPELQDKKRLYCSEHGVYEDECTLCHPELKVVEKAAATDDTSGAKTTTPAKTGCADGCGTRGAHPPRKGAPKAQAKEPTPAGPACKAHGVSESACILCNPGARQKGRLWCKEHARYEDRCWLCHPEMKEDGRAYCDEHHLYEDECFYCDPSLLNKSGDGDKHSHVQPGKRLYCKEHAVFEDECAICQPGLAPGLGAGEDLKIRFASKESASKAGVETATPAPVTGGHARKAYAEVSYNRNKLAIITPLAGGVIKRVLVDVGATVSAGDVLAEITSTKVAESKRLYLEARLEHAIAKQEYQRQESLNEERIAAQRDVQSAKAAVARAELAAAAAKQILINLGLTEQEIKAVGNTNDTSATLIMRAPFAGTITDRSAVQGSAIEAGTSMLQLADLNTMWIELSVTEDALQELSVGQIVTAQFSALGDVTIAGKVSWIATTVDKRTRMVRARAVVENPSKLLRAGLYGEASITIGSAQAGLAVPRSAIQRFEQQPFVFLRQDADLYLARRVDLGPRIGDQFLVTAGLNDSDPVVIAGTHVVFSEMMKSRLGAGCVDD